MDSAICNSDRFLQKETAKRLLAVGCKLPANLAYFSVCCKIEGMSRFRFFALLSAHLLPLSSMAQPLSAQNITERPPLERESSPSAAFGIQAQSSGAFHYVAVSRGADTDEIMPLFVPAENDAAFDAAIAAKEEAAEERVVFFDVALKNQAVVISWETVPYGKNVVVYRSNQVFDDITALARATVVASGEEAVSPYIDYPVPGVPYYYAVVPESVVKSGAVAFRYGENTNEIPVEALGEYAGMPSGAKASLRDIPLPRLNIPGTRPPPAAFSEEAEKAVADVKASTASRTAQSRDVPFRFPEDTTGILGGEAAALKSILDSHFESESWQDLESSIARFLSLRRTDEAAARARFYLGEARYFLGNYSEALEEFLLARKTYPAKAAEWIQKTLKKL